MPIVKKCLLCQSPLHDHQTFAQYVFNDELCALCRRSLKIKRRRFMMKSLKVTTFGLYENELADALIQYKECMDEALKNIFLFEVKEWIRVHYFGCVFLCAPSSLQSLRKRGFQHVVELFKQCGVEMMDCFEKTRDVSQKQALLKDRTEIHQVLAFKKDVKLPKKRLVLIDDIITTGSTMLALQDLVKERGCKEALCLCVHPKLITEFDKKYKV